MEQIVKQGYEVGAFFAKSRSYIQKVIFKITNNPNKESDTIRNEIIEVCCKAGKPVPEFLISNEVDYKNILAFLLGLNNGSIEG